MRAKSYQEPELLKSIGLRRGFSKGASFACLPTKTTTILTKKGWLGYEDISEGMEVMTYNRDIKKNEWKPIQKIHHFTDKEVVRMSNNEWQFDSTPDHRWLGLRRTANKGKHWEIEEFIETKNIKSEFKIYNSAPAITHNTSNVSVDECELLGWIFGDGRISWSPESNGRSTSKGTKRGLVVTVTQTDRKYGKRVEDLINKLGYGTKEGGKVHKQVKKGTDCADYCLKASVARELLSRAGFEKGLGQHEIDLQKFILTLDEPRLRAFFDGFYLSEGHTDRAGGIHIAQNRGNIFDGVQLCCYLLGYNMSYSLKGSRLYPDSTCTDILLRKKTYTGSTKLVKESLGVEDTFCITTENSTFVARQGDVITITGNCLFGAAPPKLAGMLKVPQSEGKKKLESFLKQMGLDNVKDWLAICKTTYSRGKNGFYIPLPFGYWVHCSQDHKAINYLIQGTEAIMEKMAELWFEKQLVKRGLQDKAYKVLSMHDEFLCESDEDCAQEVATLMAQSFTWAGKQLYNWFDKRPEMFPNIGGPEFVIDLASAAKIGKTYWDCH